MKRAYIRLRVQLVPLRLLDDGAGPGRRGVYALWSSGMRIAVPPMPTPGDMLERPR